MESLGFTLEGRALPLLGEVELHVESLTSSRNLVKGWNAESFTILDSDVFQGMESVESGLPDMPRKSVVSTQYMDHLVGNANVDSSKDLPLIIGSRFSNSGVETRAEKLVQTSLGDMQSVDSRSELKCHRSSADESLLLPASVAKRARIDNLPSQIPGCLVHGCDKDLSSLKEYHRKHKVCEVHSKTPVVIVNGTRQRFCQQCSRFHKLVEFDEGKRSCRKRLADHNERRRKPQLDTQLGSMLFKSNFLSWQCNEPSGRIMPVTMQKETAQAPQSLVPLKFGQYFNNLPERGKPYPSKAHLDSSQSAVELSGSNSSCAHSFLSAQSQSSLSNSDFISLDNPLIFQGYRQSNLAFNPGISRKRIPDDPSVRLSFQTPQKALSEKSSPPNIASYNLCPEGADTVDLLQLSLRLQRVLEQQKYSAPENPENAAFCHPFTG